MFENLNAFFMEQGLTGWLSILISRSILIGGLVILAFLANWITKRIILRILGRIIQRTRTTWDNILLEQKVFNRLSHIAPAVVIQVFAVPVFAGMFEAVDKADMMVEIVKRAALVYMTVIALLVLNSLLNAVRDIYRTFEISNRIPIVVYLQVAKILINLMGIILVISILIQKNPTPFIAGLGGATAIMLLVFKDSILGFVAGIQLSALDMVRRGDWIEMPKYGADGDVIDISLTTVKVQNWDKTISTIPTYSLVSDSFKNWRGMSESAGRRIKRAINIDMTSVRFCDREMIGRFKGFQFISEYMNRKSEELKEYNEQQGIDDSALVNGRRLTNLGTFRAYVVAYLKHHPKIHQGMTFLVRQLQPGPDGLPIEIYVFSNDQAWANYEDIQADIFDHILAVIPEFDLKVFQNPTGSDFAGLAGNLGGN